MIYIKEDSEESLSRTDQKNLDKIYKRGDVVLIGKDTETNREIRLYSVMESRGAQTNFDLKEFFYVVGYKGKQVIMVAPTARGFQGRKNRDMYQWWQDNFLVMIEDEDALQRWLNRS